VTYSLLTDELEQEIVADPEPWLILEPHDRFLGHWEVNGFNSYYRFDLHDIIGSRRVVSPANLEAFLAACDDHGYRIVFGEDPEAVLEPYRALTAPPAVHLNSTLAGTVNGLLPFQGRGFNFLHRLDRGGVAQWSTGTGKSALQSALLKYHYERGDFRLCWSLAKGHNKINTQRTYATLAGIETVLLDGTPKQRERQYAQIAEAMSLGPVVVVTNYEKFRDDFCEFEKSKGGEWLARLKPEFEPFFDVDSLFLWDEMPTKLKTRTTKLYRAVQACLYDSPYPQWEKRRAPWLRQYMFSATPIENDPEDWFNCVRLIEPDIYGTVKDFRDTYVAKYSFFDPNKPERWHHLDEMELAAAHIVHQADKERDPEIRAQFPDVFEDPRVLDWSDAHLRTYNKLIDIAEEASEEAEEEGEAVNMLALITILQMYCDLPSMVSHSAALREAWEAAVEDADENSTVPSMEGSKVAQRLLAVLEGKLPSDKEHTKLLELKSILLDEYPEEKIIIFSRFNRTFVPRMSAWLEEWNVPYVTYTGTTRQLQDAQDAFKHDPNIRVFLSSDRGSDSINLEEARVLVNYDNPLLYSRRIQRVNRNNRITSTFDKTVVIDLMMAGSVEARVQEIIAKKKAYHDGVFGGVIANQSISAGLTGADLRYILRG
jgi:hypothetical protein